MNVASSPGEECTHSVLGLHGDGNSPLRHLGESLHPCIPKPLISQPINFLGNLRRARSSPPSKYPNLPRPRVGLTYPYLPRLISFSITLLLCPTFSLSPRLGDEIYALFHANMSGLSVIHLVNLVVLLIGLGLG